MLMPKRVRYRKQMRGRRRGYSKGGTTVAFGEYGLKALHRGWITNRQIEAARVAMTGKVMFELAGVPEDLAKDAMRLAGNKLPIKTKFVRREGAEQSS